MAVVKDQRGILLVEPNEKWAQILIDYLRSVNFHVYQWDDLGANASISQADIFEIIFLAWPHGGNPEGRDILNKLQTQYPQTPICLAVQSVYVEDAVAALEYGVVGYVLRPYRALEVRAALQSYYRPGTGPLPELPTTKTETTPTEDTPQPSRLSVSFQELEILHRLGQAIATKQDEKEVLRSIVENTLSLLQATDVHLFLYNAQKDALEFAASYSYQGIFDKCVAFPRSNGLTYNVARTGQRLVINDPQHHWLYQDTPWQLSAVCGLPLKVGNRVVGVLNIAFEHKHHQFDVKDISIVETIASQAATALRNVQLFERLKKQQELTRVIAETTGAVTNLATPWQNISELILKGAINITQADRGSICEVENGRQLTQILHLDTAGNSLGQTLPQSTKQIHKQVLRKKTTHLYADLSLELSDPLHSLPEPHYLSQIAAPIKRGTDGAIVGIICLESLHPGQFSPADQDLLEDIALHAAVALQNAESYESARQQVRQLNVLLDITQRITTFHSIKDDLQKIIDDLRQKLEYDIVSLYVYDPHLDELEQPLIAGQLLEETPRWPTKRGGIDWERLTKGPDHLFSTNPAADPYLNGPFVQREKVQTAGSIRLMMNRHPVGLLFVNRRTQTKFTESEKSVVLQTAKKAATLIYTSSILQSIVDGLSEVMGFDSTMLYLYKRPQNELGVPVIGGALQAPWDWTRVTPMAPVLSRALAGEPAYFVNDTVNDPILSGPFVTREGVKTSGYVHLAVHDQLVGILFVNWRQQHQWTKAEKFAVKLFADSAAIAIQNMQQFQEQERKQRQLNALYEASKRFVEVGLHVNDVLQSILDLAVIEAGAHFGTLQLVNDDNTLSFVAAWPYEEKEQMQELFDRMPINGPGITARAVRLNDAQLVPDVSQDPDFVPGSSQTVSELAVPLHEGDKPIGVLNVEHFEPNALNEEDRDLLISFANLAVLALQNARQYAKSQKLAEQNKQQLEELEIARNQQLVTQAVAWLGLFGAEWRHTVNQKIYSIRNYTHGLSTGLVAWNRQGQITQDVSDRIREIIDEINRIANSIRAIQIAGQVPSDLSDESVVKILIDDEVKNTVERWFEKRGDVRYEFEMGCPGIYAKISAHWLRVAMEKILNNALKAMPDGGRFRIKTEPQGNFVHIYFRDTGRGIPEEALKYFLKENIPRREGEEGTGMGSLIARFVALRHGGDLELHNTTQGVGTELLLKLPIAEQKTTSPKKEKQTLMEQLESEAAREKEASVSKLVDY